MSQFGVGSTNAGFIVEQMENAHLQSQQTVLVTIKDEITALNAKTQPKSVFAKKAVLGVFSGALSMSATFAQGENPSTATTDVVTSSYGDAFKMQAEVKHRLETLGIDVKDINVMYAGANNDDVTLYISYYANAEVTLEITAPQTAPQPK